MALSEPESCPECEGRLNRGVEETVCTECGLVVAEDRLDRGPEWRSFEEGRERTGPPLTRSRHDRGLSTEIGYSIRLTGRKRRQFARLRRQHGRSKIASKAERNQVYAFNEIRRLVSALELPESVRDRSCVLFGSAQSADLLRGRSLEGFAAAAVYATCRVAAVSRTLGEVIAVARASEAELRAAYDALNRDLGLPTGPIDPSEYLARFATRLELPHRIEARARELVLEARERGLIGGRNPSGVAGACLYTAAKQEGHDLTQAVAAEVAGVAPATLRITYHALQN